MQKFFNLIKQFMRRNPTTTFFIFLFLLVNILVSEVDSPHLSTIQSGNVSIVEWYRLLTSIFIMPNALLMITIITLITFGPSIETLYGSIKMTLFVLLSSVIGGTLLLYFSKEATISGSVLSVCGLLGVYLGLVLMEHRIVMTDRKWALLFVVAGMTFFLAAFTSFSLALIPVGFVLGFSFSMTFRQQSFRNMIKNNWKESMAKSFSITMLAILILIMPKLIDSTFKIMKNMEDEQILRMNVNITDTNIPIPVFRGEKESMDEE